MIVPKEINGYILTAKERKLYIDHDLSRFLVSDRIRKGWKRERWFEAKRIYRMPKQEVIEIIGRIKYLNKQPDTIVPYCIPAGVLRRAKEYGIDIDKVKELPV